MGSLIFHVEADTLDTKVLDSIKAFFGGQKIQIAVKSESPHQMTEDELLAKVERGRASKVSYVLPYEVLSDMANALDNDEPVDVMGIIKQYQTVQP